jgi:hypothetical protein
MHRWISDSDFQFSVLGYELFHVFKHCAHLLIPHQRAGQDNSAGRTVKSRASGAARNLLAGGFAESLFEAGNATTGVENLLLAGVEGVALAANISVNRAVGSGATSLKRRSARAGDRGLCVRGVNVVLHGDYLLIKVPGRSHRSHVVNRNHTYCASQGFDWCVRA